MRHIPVIMISSLSELDSAVRCIEMGAEDYLLKPFNPTLLKARACLGKKQAAQTERALESAKQHLETSRLGTKCPSIFCPDAEALVGDKKVSGSWLGRLPEQTAAD
jgi:DNA-binding response OmpR family regulator